MKNEKVYFLSDNLKIYGELFIPEKITKPYPGLIICHGLPGKVRSPDDKGYPYLAAYFCQEGFFVLIFNFRGTGLSEGNFDILGWARDLERALEFITSHPEVNPRCILLMGFSAGAAVSIYVAAQHKEIKGIISCAAPAEFAELKTEKGRKDFLTYAQEVGLIKESKYPPALADWVNGFMVITPSSWVNLIPPRPLLIIHAEDDEVIEVSHAQELYKQVQGQADFLILPQAGHRLRLHEAAMREALLWAKKIAFSGQK
ncbi:MAG: alpha/beta hydrolase [Thermodesulfobacteriota bacterium]